MLECFNCWMPQLRGLKGAWFSEGRCLVLSGIQDPSQDSSIYAHKGAMGYNV